MANDETKAELRASRGAILERLWTSEQRNLLCRALVERLRAKLKAIKAAAERKKK